MPKVSLRKLEANRANAQHSTGPRTPEGKATSRSNAVKHGFFAKVVMLTQGDVQEDPEEYVKLLAELHMIWPATSKRAEWLIGLLAEDVWRLRRARRFEKGTILTQGGALRTEEAMRQQAILEWEIKHNKPLE